MPGFRLLDEQNTDQSSLNSRSMGDASHKSIICWISYRAALDKCHRTLRDIVTRKGVK